MTALAGLAVGTASVVVVYAIVRWVRARRFAASPEYEETARRLRDLGRELGPDRDPS